MELRQLKTFITVAQLLSFNRAAETLNYAQSTISTQIRLLEEEFGKPLFDRLGKTIVLTETGQVLLRYAHKMLAIEKETVTQVTGRKDALGSITIRVPQSISTYRFPPILKKFTDKYTRVGFNISHCALSILQELRSGIIDLAFLLADSIQEKDLIAEVIGYEKILLLSGPLHPLNRTPSVHLKDLESQTILLPTQDCSYKMIFERMLTEENVPDTSTIELNSIEAMKRCCMEGIGVMMLPEMSVQKELSDKKLIKLPWVDNELETAVLMIRHKDKWLSPTLKYFMELVREHFEIYI